GICRRYSQEDDHLTKYLEEQNFPFIMIGKPFENEGKITHVDNDNLAAAKEGTEYLLKLGHERIGFIGGNKNLMVTIDRLAGYKQALEEANLEVRKDYVVYEEFLMSGGKHGIEQLIDLPEPPTALLVTDDLMALGVLNNLRDRGMQAPEDLSIVSFNNSM